MYIPRFNREDDLPTLHALMRQHNFAVLISGVQANLFATHLPFIVDASRGPHGTLVAHMARANPHWKSFDGQLGAMVLFQGPHHYISPAWYADQVTVPTWNYAAVHVYGKPTLVTDRNALRAMTRALVLQHEQRWDLAQAEPIMDTELEAIVGFEIQIDRIEGKFKLSQNRSVADRSGVIDALNATATDNARQLAALMQSTLDC